MFTAIVSATCNCPGGAAAWGCVLQTLQNLLNDAVALGVVLITVYIAWAGIAYLLAPINIEGREQAKTRIMNAVLGMIVMLGAWLLIDSIMKVIYNQNAQFGTAALGPWNQILQANGAGPCIAPTTPSASSAKPATNPAPAATPPAGPSSATGDCSAANLTQTWGSAALGQTFACIINNESKCQNILNVPTEKDHSSAGGRYQVLITSGYKNKPFVSTDPACVAIDNGINCDLYFHGGYSDGSANAQLCQKALLDPTCNTQIAQSVYKLSGNQFNGENWLGVGDIGGKNQACVNTYDH